MMVTLQIIRDITWSLYLGPVVAFAILIGVHKYISIETHELIRAFRSFGSIFGLSMGATILTTLIIWYQDTGSFDLTWTTQNDILTNLGVFVFLILWASNCILEIWTLDPLRKMDAPPRLDEWDKAVNHFRQHLVLHAILALVATVIFGCRG